MAIAYAVVSLVKPTGISEQPSLGAGRARAGHLNHVVRAGLGAHFRRAEGASRANFRAHIQQWRRTATARCLAWMEGGLDAATGPATPADLPRSLPDHELARIARDWVKGYLSRGISRHAAIHSALRSHSK